MTRMVLAFAGGVIAAAFLLAGAGIAPWAALALVLAAFAARSRWLRLGLCFLLGVGHFELAMQRYLDQRDALLAGPSPMAVGAMIEGLPECHERGCTLKLRLEPGGGVVRVFWNSPGRALYAGQRLRLRLALEPLWSLRNPGTFDRETWGLSRGIHTSGRVLEDLDAGTGPADGSGLDGFRQRLGAKLAEHLSGAPAAALLAALAIGDRRGLSDHHWDVLQRTGTAHLLAISGLHIGLLAGFGFFAARLGYRWVPAAAITRQGLAAAVALCGALGYAALAGFSLPTVRALAMLAVPLGALLCRRSVVAAQALTMALGIVVLIDPFAPLQLGFWLSFGAVALLLWVARGYLWRPGIGRVVRPQWAIFVGMVPLLAAAGLPVSLLAPLFNLIAIPWVTLLVLPPLFAGLVALAILPPVATLLLRAAAASLQLLWEGLELASRIPLAQLHASAGALPIVLAAAGAMLALAPRGWPGKTTGALLLLPLLFPPSLSPGDGEALVHVLDVGQGAATIVQTRKHALVYDTGPGWHQGWNAGKAVLRPFLLRAGLARPQRVVISHADMDHAGGLAGLLPLLGSAELLGSSPDERWPRCRAGEAWRWDGVDFRVLHPSPWLPYLGNDSSCVLLVQAGEGRYLLTGDIGEAVERRLRPLLKPAGAMSVPHHGSRFSSSGLFLDALKPRLAVISAGQGNRFRMPHAQTTGRYAIRGIDLLNTAECGYLRLRLGPGPDARLAHAERARSGRPWHQPGLCPPAQTRR